MKNIIASIIFITCGALDATNVHKNEKPQQQFNGLLAESAKYGKPNYDLKGFHHTQQVLGQDGIMRFIKSHFEPNQHFAKAWEGLFNNSSQADARDLEKLYCNLAQKSFKQTMPLRAHRGKIFFLIGIVIGLTFKDIHTQYHQFIKERFGLDQKHSVHF